MANRSTLRKEYSIDFLIVYNWNGVLHVLQNLYLGLLLVGLVAIKLAYDLLQGADILMQRLHIEPIEGDPLCPLRDALDVLV